MQANLSISSEIGEIRFVCFVGSYLETDDEFEHTYYIHTNRIFLFSF